MPMSLPRDLRSQITDRRRTWHRWVYIFLNSHSTLMCQRDG